MKACSLPTPENEGFFLPVDDNLWLRIIHGLAN